MIKHDTYISHLSRRYRFSSCFSVNPIPAGPRSPWRSTKRVPPTVAPPYPNQARLGFLGKYKNGSNLFYVDICGRVLFVVKKLPKYIRITTRKYRNRDGCLLTNQEFMDFLWFPVLKLFFPELWHTATSSKTGCCLLL